MRGCACAWLRMRIYRISSGGSVSRNLTSLTTVISYWNRYIWLAESRFITESHWQNTWWNTPRSRVSLRRLRCLRESNAWPWEDRLGRSVDGTLAWPLRERRRGRGNPSAGSGSAWLIDQLLPERSNAVSISITLSNLQCAVRAKIPVNDYQHTPVLLGLSNENGQMFAWPGINCHCIGNCSQMCASPNV